MKNVYIIKKVYLGFALLTALIIAISLSAVYEQRALGGNLKAVNDDAVKLLVDANHIAAEFLMLSRQLNMATSQHYIDEFEAEALQLTNQVEQFVQHWGVFYQNHRGALEHGTLEYGTYGDQALENNSLSAVMTEINEQMATYQGNIAQIIDKKLQILEGMWPLLDDKIAFGELSNLLLQQGYTLLAASGSSELSNLNLRIAILQSQTQEGLLHSELSEIRAAQRINMSAQSRYADSIDDLQREAPALYDRMKPLLDQYSNAVYGETGTLNAHYAMTLRQTDLLDEIAQNGTLEDQIIDNVETITGLSYAYTKSLSASMLSRVSLFEKQLMVGGLIGLAFAVAVSVHVGQSIRKALSFTMANVEKVSRGDLTKGTPYWLNNEFGKLGGYIEKMVEQLSSLITRLTLSADTLSESHHQTQHTTQQLSSALDEQRGQVIHISSSLEELECSMGDITHSICASRDQASEASDSIHSLAKGLEQNLTVISLSSDVMATTQATIHELAVQSEKVSNVSDIIQSVADQTNLLALNAAIEAARAGEHGRGFSVVADEVRVLASKTSDSTNEIKSMIEGFRQQAEQSVSQIIQVVESVEEAKRHAQENDASLQTVLTKISEMEQSNIQIASSAMQQKQATQDIAATMHEFEALACQNAEHAQALYSSSQKLEALADEQRAITHQFTISPA